MHWQQACTATMAFQDCLCWVCVLLHQGRSFTSNCVTDTDTVYMQRTEEQRAEARDIAARDRTNIDDEEKKRRIGLGILMLVTDTAKHDDCACTL